MSNSPPPAEEPVLQGGDAAEQDAPASNPPADDAAPSNAGDDGDDADKPKGDDAAAATAAAAAVAARLMAEHGQQAYPVGSGAEHENNSEFVNNKRAREDDEAANDLEGPDKKRPTGMTSAGFEGSDPPAGDLVGEGGAVDPSGAPPSADMVSETFDVPAAMVGKLIGKGGETIRNLQLSTDTRIQVDHTGEGPNKRITISGYTADHVQRAKDAVMALDVDEAQRIVECPPNLVGRIIGRGGETIRALQSASEAHITVNQDFPPDQNRQVVIQGGDQSIERAVLMVNELIHGEPGSAQAVIQRICQAHGIGKSEVMTAPKMIIGRIIGRGGETIKQIQKTSGATVQIEQSGDPCKLSLAGQPAAVEQAKAYITELINGGDPFGTSMMGGGGYGGGPGAGYGGGGGGPGGYGGYGGYPPPQAAAGGYGVYPGAGGPGGYGGGGYPPQAAMYGAGGGYGGYPTDPYAAAQQYGAGGGYPVGGGEAAAAAGAAAVPAAGGGSAWQEYKDDQGRAYYYNATTNVTQWEKPADF